MQGELSTVKEANLTVWVVLAAPVSLTYLRIIIPKLCVLLLLDRGILTLVGHCQGRGFVLLTSELRPGQPVLGSLNS